jgi:hypothetical protein
MAAVWQDLRFALRSITRAPTLSFAVLLALSAGIGLNTAVFGVWFESPAEVDPRSFVQAVPTYKGWFDTGESISRIYGERLRGHARASEITQGSGGVWPCARRKTGH